MGAAVFLVHQSAQLRHAAHSALQIAGHRVLEFPSLDTLAADAEARRADLLLVSWHNEIAARMAVARIKSPGDVLADRVMLLAPEDQLPIAIRALEYGVDECVVIPFCTDELVARSNACLRRPPAAWSPEKITAGQLVVDKAAHRVLVGETAIDLAPAAYRLLTFFVENQGRVYSRSELLARAWERKVDAGPRTVDVHVRRLRKLLEPFGCQDMIQTVRGFGYRFSVQGISVARAPGYESPLQRLSV